MANRGVKDPLEHITSPDCPICGEPLAGYQTSWLKLPIQARYSPVFNEVIFVVDPDVPLTVQALPNGQIILRITDAGGLRDYCEYTHVECERVMLSEYYGDYGFSDPDERDETTERDEVFLEG
jgi:hypothetical protein